MRILVGQRTRPDHNLTIYDETKFSSCHTPYINSILHPATSYYFLSHEKLFQADNSNVNVRPDLLYFSILHPATSYYFLRGILKNIPKHKLWTMKTAKTLCTSSRRLAWWNVIHSTEISVVLLALKAKGQKLLYAPRMFLQLHFHRNFDGVSLCLSQTLFLVSRQCGKSSRGCWFHRATWSHLGFQGVH